MKRVLLALGAGLCFGAMAAGNHDSKAQEVSEYSYETVAAYAESWDFAIRWGPGVIKVADETGILKKEPKIIELLNMNLGETKMVLVDTPTGDITIKLVDELPAPYGQNGCGLSQSQLGLNGSTVVSNIIRIKTNNRCMGKNEGAALLLHELGHALGFAKHAKEDDVMSTHDPAFEHNKVNITTLQRFLKGLYSLDVGQKIPGKQLMPEPRASSFAYISPIEEKGPVIATKPNPEEALPEVTFAHPQMQYRKVEVRDSQGRVSWEFVQTNAVGGSATAPNTGNGKAAPAKKGRTSRFETIEPGATPSKPMPLAMNKIEPQLSDDESKGYILFGPGR